MALAAGILLYHNFTSFPRVSDYLHIIVVFISLFLAYLITFSAIEVDSPSMMIVKNIESSGSRGLTKQELLSLMTDDRLLRPRILDLAQVPHF